MTVTLDTNVLIAAFISRGQCHELLEHLVRHHRILSSAFILEEFQDKLISKFKIADVDVAAAVDLLSSKVEIVEPQPLPEPVCRDPDDDWVLATAVAGKSECLITGDKDLLSLGRYAEIEILPPSRFWEFESGM